MYGYESLVRGRAHDRLGHADDCPLPHEHADDAHRVRACENAILIHEYGPVCCYPVRATAGYPG